MKFCGQGRWMGRHVLVCLLRPHAEGRHHDLQYGVSWWGDYL